MLISSYNERNSRSEEKKYLLLRFLRDELWTNSFVASLVLGLSKTGVYKTLSILERDNYIVSHYIPELKFNIWGITPKGLLYSWADHEVMEDRSHFEPSKVKSVMIQHHIDLQIARLQAEKAGWREWVPGNLLPKGIKKRPDSVVFDRVQNKVAIELERSIKTKKRYEIIFSIYLQAIKRGEYHAVQYVCPDPDFAIRLKRMFSTIESVPVAGHRVNIGEKHRARFPVYCLENWPGLIS